MIPDTRAGFRAAAARSRALIAALGAWFAVYGALYTLEHTQLLTNGFDLSVFDYALWSTLQGHPGWVPFFGHSLLAEHFMPTLLVLAPLYALWPSPAALLAVQLLIVGAAGALLHHLARRQLPAAAALALTFAFLFSRRTHSALEAWFHVEALEPLLIFGLVWAVAARRWAWYAVMMVLALGCKEDMPVYLGLFGAYLAMQKPLRKVGAATIVVSAAWLVFAFGFAIPQARAADGLPRANPFLEARFGDPAAPGVSVGTLARRIFSVSSVGKVVNVTGSVAFLCWAAPGLLVVTLPGVAANLAGRADSLQAGLIAHYLWPVLPWVFLAAIDGGRRLLARWPRLAAYVVVVLVGITVIDSPLWRVIARRPWRQHQVVRTIKTQLREIPADADLLCQASLIPHVPHRAGLQAIGRELESRPAPEYVALSTVGDLWPLDPEASAALIERLKRDDQYTQVTDGPLFIFRRGL